MKNGLTALVACTVFVCAGLNSHAEVPSTMSVQGSLTDSSGTPLPAGVRTFNFKIFDDNPGGIVVWPDPIGEDQGITTNSRGIWSARIGAVKPLTDSVFSDTVRWLEISIDDGINPVETLPRIRLVTGPFAYRVATIDGASAGTVAGHLEVLGSGSIGGVNTVTGKSGFAAGQSNVLTGNVASIGGGVNNTASGRVSAIGGGEENRVSADWATVAGGGNNMASALGTTVGGGRFNAAVYNSATVGGGANNRASALAAVVSGGSNNTASGEIATVGGGWKNAANADYSTIAGGVMDTANALYSTIGGGELNKTEGLNSTIGGGARNLASGPGSTIAGGEMNVASARQATIGGGASDTASGQYSTIAGGESNHATHSWASVGGGNGNRAAMTYTTVGGGIDNTASGEMSTVGGGSGNRALGLRSTIGGGISDTAWGSYSTVGGGRQNMAISTNTTVGGGERNYCEGQGAVIGGGQFNVTKETAATIGGGAGGFASGNYSTVAGGDGNQSTNTWSAVGGGEANTASGAGAAIAGGSLNEAIGDYSSVDGGSGNKATGDYATIPGGVGNRATAYGAHAAGIGAQAAHGGTFVWADSSVGGLMSSGPDQFLIQASGGVGIGTNEPFTELSINGSIGFKNDTVPMLYMYESCCSGPERSILAHSTGYPNWGISYRDSDDEMLFKTGLADPILSVDYATLRLGVGTDNPTNIIQVVQGSPTDPVADAWGVYSSRRWKEHVRPIDDALGKVQALRGVTFDWKANGKHDIGLIAEEVGEVVPEVVAYEENGVDAQSVDYARLVALLIEGMKEQQVSIERLEAEVRELHRHASTDSPLGDR